MLTYAVVFITLALIFYTVGVFLERHQGELMWRHFFLFLAGLVCDTTGTILMSKLAKATTLSFHSVTGTIAIVLMLIHTIWALYVLVKSKNKKTFHRFSLFVWILWLIPYISGMVFGMM